MDDGHDRRRRDDPRQSLRGDGRERRRRSSRGRAQDELAWALADVFEYRVDMSRDLQAGDAFRVLAERDVAPDGRDARSATCSPRRSRCRAASIDAVRFDSSESSAPSYFDANGKSMRAAFLRAPLEFRRISSVFGDALPSDPRPVEGAQGHRLRGVARHAGARDRRRRRRPRGLGRTATATCSRFVIATASSRATDICAASPRASAPARASTIGQTVALRRHDRARAPGRTSTSRCSSTASSATPRVALTLHERRAAPGARARARSTQLRDRLLASLDARARRRPAGAALTRPTQPRVCGSRAIASSSGRVSAFAQRHRVGFRPCRSGSSPSLAGSSSRRSSTARARSSLRVAPLAALRALAVDARRRAAARRTRRARARRSPPEVALDASASWLRGAPGCGAWQRGARLARALGGIASSLRRLAARRRARRRRPTDHASRLRAVADRARAARAIPSSSITDGELDDPDALLVAARAARASIVMPRRARRDLARRRRSTRRARRARRHASRRASTVVAGGARRAGRHARRCASTTRSSPRMPVDSLGAVRRADGRAARRRRRAPSAPRCCARSFARRGDAEPRNDTLVARRRRVARGGARVRLDVARLRRARRTRRAARRDVASDARLLSRRARRVAHRRHARARRARARCAAAVRDAPVAILHGDTALFGPPRSGDARPARCSSRRRRPTRASGIPPRRPPSPLAPALSGAAVGTACRRSAVAPSLPHGEWQGLLDARAGARGRAPRGPRRHGTTPRRVAVLGASGFWRWRFRGGAARRRVTARCWDVSSTGSPPERPIVAPRCPTRRRSAPATRALAARRGRPTALVAVDAARGAAHRRASIR